MCILEHEPQRIARLRENSRLLFGLLKNIPGTTLSGDPCSPLMHLRIEKESIPRSQALQLLRSVHSLLLNQKQVLVFISKTVPTDKFAPPPSIRITVSADHKKKDLEAAAAAIKAVFAQVLQSA